MPAEAEHAQSAWLAVVNLTAEIFLAGGIFSYDSAITFHR